MGYEKTELAQALTGPLRFSVSRLFSDAVFMTLGAAHAPMDLSGLKRQVRQALSGRRCYAAT